jgi:adenine-specific DNA-methyltransferase
MEKLELQTPDLVKKNIERIKELFPGCVTEAKDEKGQIKEAIDFDLLRQELSSCIVEGPEERYHLDWPGKKESLLLANSKIDKTLRPCPEESVNFDTTKNLFIEGDNLDALKLMQEAYLGKVKMIYIDPPYNTGNDFIYADDFKADAAEYLQRAGKTDEEGNRLESIYDKSAEKAQLKGRFHSNWLSMMHSRLRATRDLLMDDGVIFISIDDNEVHNLRKICDEVFGAENFVATFSWRSRTAKADVPFGVSCDVEWIVCYGKSSFVAGREGERKYYKSEDFSDRWRLQDLTTNKTKEERPNSFFTIVDPKNDKEYNASESRTWCVTKDTFPEYYKNGKIVFPDDYEFLNIKRPAFRVFEREDQEKALQKYGVKDVRMAISSFLPEKDVCRTEHGSKEIRELFKSQIFPYPKPIGLIKFFLKSINGQNDIILDFFAGSSTTAHAVMQLNAEDGGNRQFIMVQLPEECNEKSEAFKAGYKNIAEISKERIRRAGKKILADECDENWNKDTGFRVLKVDSSCRSDVFLLPDGTEQSNLTKLLDNIKKDRSPEDLLFQVLVDRGVELTLPIEKKIIMDKTVFFVDENALIACFDKNISEELIKELAKFQPLRVVFRDSGFASDADKRDKQKRDAIKINAKQIFKQLSPNTEFKSI